MSGSVLIATASFALWEDRRSCASYYRQQQKKVYRRTAQVTTEMADLGNKYHLAALREMTSTLCWRGIPSTSV